MLKIRRLNTALRVKRGELDALRERDREFEEREAAITADLDEITVETPQEERDAVDTDSRALEQERAEHDAVKAALEAEIAALETELRTAEADQARRADHPAAPAVSGVTRPVGMDTGRDGMERSGSMGRKIGTAANRVFGAMPVQERAALLARPEVREWLENTRSVMRRDDRQQRAVSNVGLTIPDVMLDLLRANMMDYSRLYRHVRLRSIRGDARQLISSVPEEAVWTDCHANLNEMNLSFYQDEFGSFRVGGYYCLCNADIEDSDLDLAAEILRALSESIGMAVDKAILYGRNASGTLRMPQGILSRLLQTAQPDGYPATARPWADLSSSNVFTIAAGTTGAALFQAIIRDSGAMWGRYVRGEKTWVMNEKTRTALMAEALSINAAGAVVSGFGNTMPVLGGAVETLEFLPNDLIVGGYFGLYTLVERAGTRFASSEHVRFLQDETVFKGTARYDGSPSVPEAFVAIGLGGVTPTAAMSFAPDNANAASEPSP